MAEHFLAHLVNGKSKFRPGPWYNPVGDCIVFKTEDVAVLAERIDDVLTIYRHPEENHLVGFQLKGIRHLIQKLRPSPSMMTAARGPGQPQRVSVPLVLMVAYGNGDITICRREGYSAAQTALDPEAPAIPLAEVTQEFADA